MSSFLSTDCRAVSIDVNEEGVTLDLNYYASGVIKAADMSKDPSFSILCLQHFFN